MSEEWRIEKLVPGGAGMARLADGRIGFAAGALPNERILVEESRTRKGYREATRFRVIEPARERVTAPCAVAAVCGGCDFLHVAYAAQLELKAGLLREALQRTGGFRDLPPIQVEASPRELAYRSRLRVHIDAEGQLGFHARKTRRLVVIESCAVARPELDAALATLRDVAARHRRQLAAFVEAELRVAPGGDRPSVRLTPRTTAESARRAAHALLELLGTHFSVAITGVASGHAERWPLADGLALWVPPEAFVQVNWDVNRSIVRALVAGARQREARSFLELYAGAGNFTLALLGAGLSGSGVESQPEAVRAARRSLAEHGFGEGGILVADAVEFLERSPERGAVDLVVLDPPRSGARDLVQPLTRARPRFVAYCSCDPVTLARDLRALCADGFVLESVAGFDMFPGTHHVEALAWLRRA